MYLSVDGKGSARALYIKQSFHRGNGKNSTKVLKKLGKYDDLIKEFNGDKEKLMEWGKKKVAEETQAFSEGHGPFQLSLYPDALIAKDQDHSYGVGYLFLQQLCTDLRIDNICRNIRRRHRFSYDIEAILTDLIYARILAPASKLSSYEYCRHLLEPPKYPLEDVYRALSVLAGESDYIQEELYRNSNFVHHRNTAILYYDCTNYYFETEEESGMRRYGKSKEHRPNPIVEMGLFMDADGLPLCFDVFNGNQSEQTTLKPIESKILKDFGCGRFIFCSDAGLGSAANRRYNSFGGRSYVITHSLKKMKEEDQKTAMDPRYFQRPGRGGYVDLRTINETDPEVYDTVYYKEIPIVTGNMDETLIVTYSPKYKAYQRRIRAQQVARAEKIVNGSGRKRRGKNQNDPARFIRKDAVTAEGEAAETILWSIDEERIREEEKYDGFYAVITDLEDDPCEIIRINRQRWEIEDNFRIMKTEFEARPVYVRRDDRIRAHFLTCCISLLIYRLLEQKLEKKYTCHELLETLRRMNTALLPGGEGYIPAYRRTEITDALHEAFGFRTDRQYISKAAMRSIIKNTKTVKTSKAEEQEKKQKSPC